MLENLKSRARALKTEVHAIYFAARDPRTPWYAKAIALFTVAYAFSPIDLIPDFVPVLGYLDDLIIVPAGLALAVRLIPPEVMGEARLAAAARKPDRSVGYIGAILIMIVWIVAAIGIIRLVLSIQ